MAPNQTKKERAGSRTLPPEGVLRKMGVETRSVCNGRTHRGPLKGANKKREKEGESKEQGQESPEKAEQRGPDLSRSLKQKDFI